jgi:divalent metal cation (Fe/Co/Zn/Cd) transporter
LVFGLENCVDLLSSIVVVWRFYAPGNLTKELIEHLEKREERASMAISFILILLGVFVFGGAAKDFANGAESDYDMSLILGISFCSIIVFGILARFKFHYSKQLSSSSLYKDGLCSLLGTVLAVALFVNTLIIEKNPATWWLDPAASMICGIVAFALGVTPIVAARKQGVPIFKLEWWLVSQGDGKGEMGGETEIVEKDTSSMPKLSDVV